MSSSDLPILQERSYYKPFDYEFAFEAFRNQNFQHWVPEEVPMSQDKTDFDSKLTESEKSLLTNLFRFFTQADIDVADGYVAHYMPVCKKPELRMMLMSFAAMEAIHIAGYSHLIDTLALPESEYKEFLKVNEMRKKHDHMRNLDFMTIQEKILRLSVFGEGLQLFSTFAILMNFQRFNKMKGMCQIVAWSIRDEDLHVDSMVKVLKTIWQEAGEQTPEKRGDIALRAAVDAVVLEDKFIDVCFRDYEIEGLTKEEVKQYIRYIADYRLKQIGMEPHYNVPNPFQWLDWLISAPEHTNFFENRSTAYSKGTVVDDWDAAWELTQKGD